MSPISLPSQESPSAGKVNPPVVCVYCGSSPGNDSAYLDAARAFAKVLHQHGFHLVYGGGTTGIMGAIAREVVKLSGPDAVQGYIPAALVAYERGKTGKERDNTTYGRFEVVPDMHTRKMLMARRVQCGGPGSGFVALSGGLGTIEELMEIATWQQLGIHSRGVCLLNVGGYWDGLVNWVEKVVVGKGFLSPEHWHAVGVQSRPEDVVKWLQEWRAEEKGVRLDWRSETGTAKEDSDHQGEVGVDL
ncbi:hypothetical protein BDV32DRAFT_146911 [Aspergillus pseudonomiae]|nr:hypothetical protein BDV32DRAFT_146911 [Aspergillus pseudonomiae]